MNDHEKYIKRCIELAMNGAGNVAPNPMVGSVIVFEDTIISEGFHTAYGKPHAEAEAINNVPQDKKDILSSSTLYVNLEPCSHHGKTPPCADLIIKHKIPRVVTGSRDPNPLVAGSGIKKLKENGVEVIENILNDECVELNRRFFTYYTKKRPYIILKWAQTADGYLAPEPKSRKQISNHLSQVLAHRWRSEEQAIMIGYNTAAIDNPELNVRLWEGRNPLKIVFDPKASLPANLNIFNGSPLLIFNHIKDEVKENAEWIKISPENYLDEIIHKLYERNIISVMVEGGASLLQQFINNNLWDEGRIFEAEERWGNGLKAPAIPPHLITANEKLDNNKVITYRNR